MPVESGPSGADTPGADGDNVNVDEEISTTADIAPPRPWRPRGVRAGRRLKKRYGVSAVIARASRWTETFHQEHNP